MTFQAIFDPIMASAPLREHEVSDGTFTCSYQELPVLFDQFDQRFATKGINQQSCLAFLCGNTLPAALTLLYLLRGGYHFFLLPKQADETIPLPGFCRWQVGTGATDTLHPDSFLAITANEGYRGALPQAGPSLYLRTSGSMSNSKIVVYRHERLLANARNCVERFRLTAADRVSLPVPIFHMYGLGAGFLPAVIAGATIDLQENTNILKYLQRERQFTPNVVFLTPTLCEMLVQGKRNPGTYRTVVTAGARIKEETFRQFEARFGNLVNLYGSTEMGAVAAAHPDDPLDRKATTIGLPMPGVELEIRFADSSQAASSSGELYCRHPYGFEGYIDQNGHPLAAAEAWYPTGDLAQRNADGYIQILGRRGDSVNRRGYLVQLADIERCVGQLTEIEQVVVTTIQGETAAGQRIAAFCVLRAGEALTEQQLRSACFDLLPNYAIPDEVRILKALPLLPSGKVDRRSLAALLD